jgi:periplasmic protein TonB
VSAVALTPAGNRRRPGRVWLRWGVSFGAVLAVHVSIFLGLHRTSPAVGVTTQTAIMMDMAPEPTAAPATPASPVAQPPLPQPPLAQPPPPPLPMPDSPPPVRQAAVPLPPPMPRPPHARPMVRPRLPVARPMFRPVSHAPAAAVPAPSAPSSLPAPPAARPAATPAAPPPGQVLAAWQAQLLAHLARFKRFPPGAQERGEQGVVRMRVTLDHAGNVLSMTLVGSSGYPDLDAEAPAWIARAAPLPAFPPEITAQQVNLVIPLRFTLQ